MVLSVPIKKLPPNAKGEVRYRFVVDVGADPVTGKRKQVTRTFGTLREAKAEYARITNRRYDAALVPAHEITVNEWLDQWLAKKAEDLEESTVYSYRLTLDRVRGKLGQIRLQELTEDLQITSAASTIALRGHTDDPATYDIRLTVGDDATLHRLPQPLISTAGSNLRQTCTVDLASTARLVLRDEQILGRTGETSGNLTTRLTVLRAGRPLLDQHTSYGGRHPGWDGPAVMGSHRACGQLLVVDPSLTPAAHPPILLGDLDTPTHGVLAPLAGPALLATAVADTATRLRLLLDEALQQARTP